MAITLHANDSINLTTGVVTRRDWNPESAHHTDRITYPTGVSLALRRNNLRALHLAILDSVCAWTPEACHRSQAAHGRGDDCGWHPWASTPEGERCHFCSQPVHGATLCN